MYWVIDTAAFPVIGVGIAAFGLAALGYVRTKDMLKQQRRALQGLDLEFSFEKKAIDEHSLTTVTDTHGIILDVNTKFLDTFGYKREDLIGRHMKSIYFEDDVALSEEIRLKTPQGQIWTGETRLKRADGSLAFTQTTVVPLIDENGHHVKNLTLRIDVTRFRAKENEKLITSVFDNMLDAVVLHDPETASIIYMNDFALADNGWSRKEAMARTLWDTIYVTAPEKMAGVCDCIKRDGKCTVVLDEPDTDWTYEARSYAVNVEGGESRVLTIFRDVTQSVEMERERNRLVSVITHELRTPLTSIKGSLGLLEAGSFGPMSTEAKSLVNMALRNSDRMLELIREILDAERAEKTRSTPEFRPVNLGDCVDAAIHANLGYGSQLGIDFVNPGSSGNLWVMGDEAHIQQILSNLMSNAAKFSPDGAPVFVSATQEGDHAVLHVQDQGSGIPENLQQGLFDWFSDSVQSERGGVHGSGLGLAIVKSLVDKLNGEIDFDTEAGKGTCFHVRLPVLAEKQERRSRISAAE